MLEVATDEAAGRGEREVTTVLEVVATDETGGRGEREVTTRKNGRGGEREVTTVLGVVATDEGTSAATEPRGGGSAVGSMVKQGRSCLVQL